MKPARYLTRPPRPHHTLVNMALLAGLLSTVTAFAINRPDRLWLQAAQARAHIPSRSPVQVVDPQSDKHRAAQEKAANDILAQLDRTWATPLLIVEQSTHKDIALLEFHPDYTRQQMILKGEARQFKDIAAYVDRMRHHPLVRNAELQHEVQLSREHVETVEFELVVHW
ncbi:PilN domain-containing protein [Burkholderiaceae bacterium DAT-1]|nr:PilN domain-containing protein [Burkholderiaceae bacterium DAT-1]